MKQYRLAAIFIFGVLDCIVSGAVAFGQNETGQRTATENQSSAIQKNGKIQALDGNVIILKGNDGNETKISIPGSVQILRVSPGEKDLSHAQPATFQDLQVNDRLLVRGRVGDDPHSLVAGAVILMKMPDLAQKQAHDREAWQKGIGGTVQSVDLSGRTVTVGVSPGYTVTVRAGQNAGILHYGANSVKFADAGPGRLDEIKVGDQLRARGSIAKETQEFLADQIIYGSFKSISGIILAVDSGNHTLTMKDVIARKTMTVKIGPDCQLRKLAAPAAQRLAVALGARSAASGGQNSLAQILGQSQTAKFGDLRKDDGIMVLASYGEGQAMVTGLALLGGVEPILTASPDGRVPAALLAGWNISSAFSDSASQ